MNFDIPTNGRKDIALYPIGYQQGEDVSNQSGQFQLYLLFFFSFFLYMSAITLLYETID